MHKIDAPGATANNRFTEGDPAAGVPATEVSAAWLNAVQSELVKVIESAGLTLKDSEGETGDQLLAAMQAMGLGTGQFQKYSSLRTYETGETCRGSDGHFYEFYDRDQSGTVVGLDPANAANRPHIWMRWDGVRPATVIEWRSETLPEGYVTLIGDDISRNDYRRIWNAWGTTHGAGDGVATFGTPNDIDNFKRGWDFGASGRGLAEHQADALQNITGSLTRVVGNATNGMTFGGAFLGSDTGAQSDIAGGTIPTWNVAFDASRVARTANETRSRNNVVIYLAKI